MTILQNIGGIKFNITRNFLTIIIPKVIKTSLSDSLFIFIFTKFI